MKAKKSKWLQIVRHGHGCRWSEPDAEVRKSDSDDGKGSVYFLKL